ncbi:MAG: YfgM family protein [Pseudomonadota bacterium]
MSYLTDEEKAERIKQWWSENAVAIVAGLVLGIAGLFGWNWWTDRQEARAQAGSDLYLALQATADAGDLQRAAQLADQVIEQGRGTPYESLAWVYRADAAIAEADVDGAVAALRAARDAAPDDGYRNLMMLRLARQLILAERLDEAEAALAEVRGDAFHGLRRELQGDLARARGDRDQALEFYREALDAGHSPEYLRLKFEELAA